MHKEDVTPRVQAVLSEIAGALDRLSSDNEGWTVFIDKMGLNREERQLIREILGQGAIRIKLEGSLEPAEWLETGISGVWYGVFYDPSERPILETIEVGFFPQVAAAQSEDIQTGRTLLGRRIADLAGTEV